MILLYKILLSSYGSISFFTNAAVAEPLRGGIAVHKDILSLAEDHDTAPSNDTFQDERPQVLFGPVNLRASPDDLSPYYKPRGLDHLLKRDQCTLPNTEGQVYTCITAADVCCTDKVNTNLGWCCSSDLACGSTSAPSACYWSVTAITSWDTTTIYATETSTDVQNVAETTEWSTEVSTTIVVVTESDVATSTEVKTVTVTASGGNKKRHVAPFAAPTPHSLDTQTRSRIPGLPMSTARPDKAQQPISPRITSAPKVDARGRLKRQNTVPIRTETNTEYSTSTDVQTRVVYITSINYYTATSTETSTYTSTSTYALNAKTTVTSTTTYTYTPGQTNPPPTPAPASPTSSDPPQSVPQQGKAGLSTGAQAGIGVGTASGSLIICLILAFFLRRRRKKRAAETADLINQAVTAATAAQYQHPQNQLPPGQLSPSQKPPDGMMYAAGPIPSPPPPSSPHSYSHSDRRYSSGLMPVYDQGGAGTPAPRYESGMQMNPMGTPMGYEVSATPVMAPQPLAGQYQYQRPLSPQQAQEMYQQHNLPEMQAPPR